MDFFGNVGLNKLISLIKSKFENIPVFNEEEEETSEIKQLYNRLKTEKVYPITKTKAIYDDNGNRLDNRLDLLDTIQLTDQYQTTLSAGLMSLINDSTLPAATTMHYQLPAELPERGWYIVSLTRSRETAYSGTAVLLKNPAKMYTVFGSMGSEPYVGNYENAIMSTVSYSDTTQTLQKLIEIFCCPKTPVGMTKQFVIGSSDGWFRVDCNNFNNDRYTGFCFEFTTSTTPKRYSFFSMGGASSVMIPFRSDADAPSSATLANNGVLAVKNNAGTQIYTQTFTNSYNAGVTDADARVNVNSANYKGGYNAGVAAYQPKSATLANNGVLTVKNNAGTSIYSQTFSNSYDAGVTYAKNNVRYYVTSNWDGALNVKSTQFTIAEAGTYFIYAACDQSSNVDAFNNVYPVVYAGSTVVMNTKYAFNSTNAYLNAGTVLKATSDKIAKGIYLFACRVKN